MKKNNAESQFIGSISASSSSSVSFSSNKIFAKIGKAVKLTVSRFLIIKNNFIFLKKFPLFLARFKRLWLS
jgi:hypothetical protein